MEPVNLKGAQTKMMNKISRNLTKEFSKKETKIISAKINKHTIWGILMDTFPNNLTGINLTCKYISLDPTLRKPNTLKNRQPEKGIITRNIQDTLTIWTPNMDPRERTKEGRDSMGSGPELKEYQGNEERKDFSKRRSSRGKSCPSLSISTEDKNCEAKDNLMKIQITKATELARRKSRKWTTS